MMRIFLISTIYLLLLGCSSVPPIIRSAPTVDLPIDAVRNNVAKYTGNDVRWGGVIISVQNEQNYTDIQLLYYPLNSYGRPNVDQSSPGRFIVSSPAFLDPAIYLKGSELTIAGKVKETVERKVGNKTLILPVIDAEEIYLWPKYPPDGLRPYRYDPYFDYGFYPHFFYGYPFYCRYPFCY